MMRRSPCMGSAADLATVSSSNQVGRKDLTPMVVLELLHLISSRRRLWYTGGTIQAGINTSMQLTFHATLTPVCLNSAVMHRTCPSTVEVPLSQPCFEHFFQPCFRGHDEAGLLAFEALRGSPRPEASDAKRNGTRTKRGSRGLESI